jgi:prepilin-type N-terminal cleavage/methylation domain-containing protein
MPPQRGIFPLGYALKDNTMQKSNSLQHGGCSYRAGFTLVELLVVIAIIGIPIEVDR